MFCSAEPAALDEGAVKQPQEQGVAGPAGPLEREGHMQARKSFRRDRNLEIALAILKGKKTLSSVAEEYKLSVERIRQIVYAVCEKINALEYRRIIGLMELGGGDQAAPRSSRSHRLPHLRARREHFVGTIERMLG